MASQSAEKEAKKEYFLISLPFHWCFPQSIGLQRRLCCPWVLDCCPEEAWVISRNHWLIQHPLLTIVACRMYWHSFREACPFALLLFPPIFSQTHHAGLSAAPVQGCSLSLCEAAGTSCGAIFCALPLPSAVPCPALPPPSLLPVLGAGEMGWARWGHGGFEKRWVQLSPGGVPCPCWQLPSSASVENLVLYEGQSATSEPRECGSHVFSLCLDQSSSCTVDKICALSPWLLRKPFLVLSGRKKTMAACSSLLRLWLTQLSCFPLFLCCESQHMCGHS